MAQDYLRSFNPDERKLKTKDDADIQRLLEDESINERDKFTLVRSKAKYLEERAKQEEQLLLLSPYNHKQVEKALGVNKLYVKTVEAKLKMLNIE